MQFIQIFLNPLLHNRNFMLLYSSLLISLVGSGLTTIGLALFAHQLVEGNSAAIVIGNALMLRILAFLLFSQFAGILADRVNRKTILIATDVVRLGLLGLFPFVESVWQIYVMIFMINAATAFLHLHLTRQSLILLDVHIMYKHCLFLVLL